MHKFYSIVLAALITAGAGCHSTSPTGIFSYSRREDVENLKAKLHGYKHVILVCVYGDYWEDKGPHQYSLHHFKATVIRNYKGSWRFSERIAFVHGVDRPALVTRNVHVGEVVFLFTNERTNTEIGIDAGEFRGYDAAFEQMLRLALSNRVPDV